MSLKPSSEILVQSILHAQVLTCLPDDSIQVAASKMQAQKASSIIIIDNNIPVGIWTEADALKLDFNVKELFLQPIKNFMSTPIQTIHQKELVATAAVAFQEQGIRHFVVIDDGGAMQGIISQSDIILHQTPEGFLHVQKVKKVIDNKFLSLDKSTSIASAMIQIHQSAVSAVIVTGYDNDKYGIITERDIVHSISNGSTSDSLAEIANIPLLTINSEQSLIEAHKMLMDNNIRHLGVIDQNSMIIGILNFEHILKSIQFNYIHHLEDVLKERDTALTIANKDLLLAHTVLESTQEGIMVVDTHGKITMVNPAFSIVTGYKPEEVIGKNPNILHSGRHNKKFYQQMWEQINKVGYWQGEIWNKRKTGEIYPEWLSINTIFDEENIIQGYTSTLVDITNRKEAEKALQESNDKFRSLVETTHDFIWEVNKYYAYTYCSPQSIDILGYKPEELLGKTPFDFMLADEVKRVSEIFIDIMKQQAPIQSVENINITKDGREVILETSGRPFFSMTGELQGYRGVDRDITQRKQVEAELKHMATHDPLTGLYNRKVLDELLNNDIKRAIRYKHSLSVFMLDIDYFKKINDTYGHQAGDTVLHNFAGVIETSIRETDYVARYGGEEFVIVLSETSLAKAEEMAGRLLNRIADHSFFIADNKQLNITASIGVATFPEHAQSRQDIIYAADSAMYAAKKAGRNQVKTS